MRGGLGLGVVISVLGTSDMGCRPYEAEAASWDYYVEVDDD